MADLIIIGAGPAGMSAALTARGLGMSVVVLDEQPAPGGQIYRNVTEPSRYGILGKDYAEGGALVGRFLACGADYRPQSSVWRIDTDGVCVTGPAGTVRLAAPHVLLATGAMERPVPTRGWTLPGVMTAGAAQVMLKAGGVVAENPVFVGSGPLFYLVVAQYLRAGIMPEAVLDTTPRANYGRALRHVSGAVRGWHYLRKGIGLLSEIRRAGVQIRQIDSYAFAGDDRLEEIRYRAGGTEQRIGAGVAFVHQGVVPAVQASMSTGCDHHWSDVQHCWSPTADDMGRTSVPWLRVAGDGAGILGAASARFTGALAALGVALDTGRGEPSEVAGRVKVAKADLAADKAIRHFLDTLYRPGPELLAPVKDDITLCRCELVSRGALAEVVAEGCPGPNQLKAFTRSGMGPCQGRICGPSVTSVMAALTGKSPAEVGYYKIRSPFRPVLLGDIAQLQEDSK